MITRWDNIVIFEGDGIEKDKFDAVVKLLGEAVLYVSFRKDEFILVIAEKDADRAEALIREAQ